VFGHARHDRGNAFGEHRLAGARWADHQNVVAYLPDRGRIGSI
jgi:hypothetical protein